MRGRWIIFIPILIAVFLIVDECSNKNHRPKTSVSKSSTYTYSNNSYQSSSNNYASQSSSASTQSPLKAKSGEMILAKAKSPGYYKTKGNQVIELWDDGTVAEAYQAIGAYKSLAEFKKDWRGVKLVNPLRSINPKKINVLLLFGPVNEDYDEYRGEMYNVYGLITVVGTGFEYYENTFGNSNTFTYIQDLEFVDHKD